MPQKRRFETDQQKEEDSPANIAKEEGPGVKGKGNVLTPLGITSAKTNLRNGLRKGTAVKLNEAVEGAYQNKERGRIPSQGAQTKKTKKGGYRGKGGGKQGKRTTQWVQEDESKV